MKTYKFKTKVSENGIIKIPYKKELYDEEVEIIIMPKTTTKNNNSKASDFVKKWAGFLKEKNIEKSKYDYLSSKYR